MRFEWDEAKRQSNIRPHGLDLADVESVFAWETATFLDDRFDYEEKRFHTYGLLWGRVVAIAHTATEEGVRIISFRKATKNEQRLYFEAIRN